MQEAESRVTIHMVASLDGFIARRDGSVDWLETTDTFDDGKGMDPEMMTRFLRTIGCYVMGSRTYESRISRDLQIGSSAEGTFTSAAAAM